MKRLGHYTFDDYCAYREDMARDIGSRVFGGSGTGAEGAAMEPLIDLIKEIWNIDREGVLNFFGRYKDDPRTDSNRIADLLDALESGKSRISSTFKRGGDPDQIVPAEADMEGGEGGEE